jgi:CMP/dCMP kinase
MIISISGTPGSGKSTVAKLLQQQLGAERIYVGGIRRELARKKGMSLAELNVYAKTHPETDVDVDKQAAADARELEKEGNMVIAEGYTMFHFLPKSVKIFIKCGVEESAQRIWKDLQSNDTKTARNEGEITSFEQMKARVVERLEEDTARYQNYYGIDHQDESHYDFVLDTSTISAEEAANKVMEFLKSSQK